MQGICGVGMAGVAYLLARRGWSVSGCDARLNAWADWLRAHGVRVEHGHDPAHLANVDCVIVTPAVPSSDSELRAAHERGLPVFRRGEVLAELVSDARGVAICGAHGKTTTSCFTARLLQELGAAPGWCIGGTTPCLGGVAGCGDSDLLVAEADESDGTLAQYVPAVTVLTGIDLDHLEHFDGEAALTACFASVVARTREGVAVCCDNARADRVGAAATVPLLRYGLAADADLRATDVCVEAGRVAFDVTWRGVSQGRIALGVAGRHNAVNALGAAAAALLLGYAPEAVFTALPRACDELPGRRYECVADVQGIRIIADYAHHPAELKVALAMAREERPARLVALFQPHRYTRTQALGPEFPPAFAEADEVILLPVYAASETPLDGGCIEDLYAHFRQKLLQNRLPTGVARASCPCFMGGTPMSRGILQEPRHSDCQQYADTAVSAPRIIGPRLKLARTLEEAWAYLRQTLAPGDLVVIAGAGDVIGMVDRIREDVARGWPVRRDPEGFETALMALPGVEAVSFGALTHWSYYQVGGWARWRVEVADEAALAAVVRLCNAHGVGWRFVGAGANSWFSDLGEAGCVIRFAPGAFRGLDVCGDEVTAECGWMGQALLDRLEREGLSGLECLDSVPGTLGGWLAMNAGAHGGEIGARVTWIRCLNPNGEIAILDAIDCGFGYRRCGGLAGRVALACGLRLERTTPEQVAMLRKAVRVKRMPLSGLRCAGSVFRNPEGTAAGRVLDAAGCKGMRIGGAYVTDFHANIVATDGTATASDVLAVVMRMRGRAERHGGVQLTAEVSGFFR